MIRRLHCNNIRAEVWAEQQAQSFDYIWPLRFSSRQAKLGKLFIWTQHNQLWTKYNSSKLKQKNASTVSSGNKCSKLDFSGDS